MARKKVAKGYYAKRQDAEKKKIAKHTQIENVIEGKISENVSIWTTDDIVKSVKELYDWHPKPY
jgi:hypothetical protein